jgi:hypothetical protein
MVWARHGTSNRMRRFWLDKRCKTSRRRELKSLWWPDASHRDFQIIGIRQGICLNPQRSRRTLIAPPDPQVFDGLS